MVMNFDTVQVSTVDRPSSDRGSDGSVVKLFIPDSIPDWAHKVFLLEASSFLTLLMKLEKSK